ncbi:MAG: hypothetical protein K0R94_554 [Burkholderiales bacterium]|jgi:hypothetical protein|nr:hypothetical protein [Burkholderiales bacterium]
MVWSCIGEKGGAFEVKIFPIANTETNYAIIKKGPVVHENATINLIGITKVDKKPDATFSLSSSLLTGQEITTKGYSRIFENKAMSMVKENYGITDSFNGLQRWKVTVAGMTNGYGCSEEFWYCTDDKNEGTCKMYKRDYYAY